MELIFDGLAGLPKQNVKDAKGVYSSVFKCGACGREVYQMWSRERVAWFKAHESLQANFQTFAGGI